MDWTQIIVTLITALLGSSGIVIAYFKVRLDKAEKENEALRNVDAKIEVQKCSTDRARLKWVDIITRKVKGELINGELDEAVSKFQEECEELQRLVDERAVLLRQKQ